MTGNYDERARREKAPIQYKVYKGISGKNGALRLNLKRPYLNPDPKKCEGVIFLEMAPAVGANDYDWEKQKVVFALGIVDIPKVILYLRSPSHQAFNRTDNKLKLIHDKGAGTARKGQEVKTLEVMKSDRTPNFMFNIYQTSGGTQTNISVPISPDEAIAFKVSPCLSYNNH
jgi:hypothetical protein